MWTRSELKSRAKEVLKGTYWKAFLVSIILTIVNGGSGGSGGSGADTFNINNGDYWYVLIPIIILVVLIAIGIGLSIRIFLGYPLEVGARRYFVGAAEREVNLRNLGYSFNSDRYLSIVGAMLYEIAENTCDFSHEMNRLRTRRVL